MTAPDLTPDHPAVEALADAIYRALSGQYGDFGTPSKGEAHAALTAALPHLTADDLPASLVRDIQARTIRAAARAATYDEGGGIPGDHCWDRATVADWLDELADNIERDGNA